jgi:hypothetical protein
LFFVFVGGRAAPPPPPADPNHGKLG